jgi:hypothetical protein
VSLARFESGKDLSNLYPLLLNFDYFPDFSFDLKPSEDSFKLSLFQQQAMSSMSIKELISFSLWMALHLLWDQMEDFFTSLKLFPFT